jgi:hypothetical protein
MTTTTHAITLRLELGVNGLPTKGFGNVRERED